MFSADSSNNFSEEAEDVLEPEEDQSNGWKRSARSGRVQIEPASGENVMLQEGRLPEVQVDSRIQPNDPEHNQDNSNINMMPKVLPSGDMGPDGYQSLPGHHNAVARNNSLLGDAIDAVKFEAVPVQGGDSKEIKWIRRYIKCRECSRFKPVQTSGSPVADPKCCCGFKFSRHSPDAKANGKPEEPWNEKTHTKKIPTNAFGDIEFVGFGQKIGKYVRVDSDSKADRVLELMMDHWGLTAPNLLISVTGGAKNFHMKPRLKEVFRRGLMKAAQSTGAWITTGGTHVGVMKHVGEAVRDYGLAQTSQKKVIAIGIATWGCIQRKEALINTEGKGKWPAHYRLDDVRMKKETPLDSNHSHFILVDNGTQHQFGVEISFRAKLETAISTMKTASGNVGEGIKVPTVLLVLEGGPGTLQTVYSSILNRTPAVIVQGSGRAADILAFAYQNAVEEEILSIDQDGNQSKKVIMCMSTQMEAEVTQMIEEEFGKNDLETHVGRVRECLQYPDLLSVFQLDSDSADSRDIDQALLKSMLKANKNQVMDQLRLALTWNRIDVAKSEIFTDDREWKTGSLDEIMLTAILLDRTDFVKLFLENGVSLREFLTIKRLLQLYNQIPENCQLYRLLGKYKKSRKFFSLQDVGNLIKYLMGDFYEPLYCRDRKYEFCDADAILEGQQLENDSGTPSMGSAFKRPERELFIWAVLMNRSDMSKLFWEEAKECIPSALVGNKLLKSMVGRTEDSDLETKLQQHAVEYEDLAIGVLNECHGADENRALTLLVRELKYWGLATCVLIAVQADNKRFISHSACQALLNTIWMGQMSKETKKWKLITCVCFPPLLFSLIHFEKIEREGVEDKQPAVTLEDEPQELKRQATKMSVISKQPNKPPDEPVEDSSISKLSVWEKLWFFFNAPVITFCYNVGSYFAFLVLYSYILLVTFSPQISNGEIVLFVWVLTICVEEIRQVITQSSSSVYTKITSYLRDMWNLVDVFTITLFMLGTALRFTTNPDVFEASRIIFAVNIMTFFMRLLHIFSVHKQLGPKLVMIGRMVVDLMYFVVILLVIIVGYGVASQAILYPNTDLSFTLFVDVMRKAYWQMFGELFLEEIEGQDACTFDPALYTNNTLPRCPTAAAKIFVPILLGFYMLLTNVLLLNLLIAMFSYTFERMHQNTDQIWKFTRYHLIHEYFDRPPLPAPLIFIAHIFILLRYALKKCCRMAKNKPSGFRKIIENSQEEKRLELWEDMNRDEFMRKTQQTVMTSLDNKVTSSHARLDELMLRMDVLQDQSSMSPVRSVMPTLKMSPKLDHRLSKLEDQMMVTFEALNWIVKSLSENNMAAKSIQAPVIPNLREQREKEKKLTEAKAKEDRELVKSMITNRKELHYKSRSSPYPGSKILRFPVPDEKVNWKVSYDDYTPVLYTSEIVLAKPVWADQVDLTALDADVRPLLKWNKYDDSYDADRSSILGLGPYVIKDGLPLNPQGRTGLTGRGLLGRWGPNQSGDPVVTRWKRDVNGEQMLERGKPVLEFIAVQREDSKQWAFPGGMCERGQSVIQCLRSEFTQEALGSLVNDPDKKTQIKRKLDTLFSKGEEIFKGYADDPRNTDNSWLETVATNYHDDKGDILKFFELRAGLGQDAVTWLPVSSKLPMYGSHDFILQQLAVKRKCAF